MLFQLVYRSSFREELKNEMDQHVNQILTHANTYNKSNEITGMLITRGTNIIQLLEGDKARVLNLYGKICSDLRHYEIETILKQESNSRLFENWTMAYKKISHENMMEFEAELGSENIVALSLEKMKVSNQQILELLKIFRYKMTK